MDWIHRPSLDGVRALAVYLVLIFHTGMATFSGGFVGVDVFFVLSGFLVTSILLNEVDSTGSLDLARFYARRVRRLLPAALVVIVATGFAFVLFTSVVRRLTLVADARSSLLYYANWHFLAQSDDYFSAELDSSPYLHFWSLAIEEQYYVAFPVVLLGLATLSRRHSWALPTGLGVLLLLSVASQLFWMRVDANHAYYGTDARLYQLLAGSLLALALRAGRLRGHSAGSGVLGLALIVVTASAWVDVAPASRGLLATVAAGLLISAMMGEGPVTRLFARPALVYLGRISYGTYLWHWPVLLLLQQVLVVRPLVLALLAGCLSTGLAALSAEILELPIRRRLVTPRWQWPVIALGVSLSAITAFAVMPPMLHSDRRPALTAVDAGFATGLPGARTPVPRQDWNAVARDFGSGHTCSEPADCFIVDEGGPTLVLIGDSHAKSMLPMFAALARERRFTLAANISDGCPWQAGLDNGVQPLDSRRECAEQRDEWYAKVLPQLQPDLVVLVEQTYDGVRFDELLTRAGGSDETPEQLLAHTTHETLDTFSALGTRSLVFQSTFKAPSGPLDCLARARYLSECLVAAPVRMRVSDAFFQAEDVARDDMASVNINRVICPDAPLCRPILDGRVVWRDNHHLTTRLLLHLRDGIWRRMVNTGILEGLDVQDEGRTTTGS